MLAETALRTVRDRVLVLRSFPTFAGLDDDAAAWMAETARVRRLPAGEVVSNEGDPIRFTHIVVSGKLRVTRKARVVDVERGFGAGFLSVLSRDEHGIHVEALEPTTTLEFPVEAIYNLYEENFSIVRGAIRNLSGALLGARGQLPRRVDDTAEAPMGQRFEQAPTLVERILVMRETGLFANVNLDAVIDVSRRQELVSYPEGTALWAIGDLPTFSLRVTYGHVRCTESSGASVIAGADYVLGSMDALSDKPRGYGAVAVTDVQGFRLGQDPFLAVLESHPTVALSLAGLLANSILEQT